MMPIVTISVPDTLLSQMNHAANVMQVSRAEYVCSAIRHLNEESQKCKQQLIRASLLVRSQSMKINAEFDQIDHETIENF